MNDTLLIHGFRAKLIGLWLLAMTASASAHHSTSAYDRTKTVELSGAVKEMQWTNPHSWIQILVTDKQGATTEWAIETGTPVINLRHGWKRDDVKAGDKISMVIYPARDGTAHGTLATITLADGRVLDGAADFVVKDIVKSLPPPPASSTPNPPTPPAK
jgi:hypothetical protein